MSNDSTSEWPSSTIALPDSAKLWAAVIGKLSMAYPPPGSRLSEMTPAELGAMARVWADELSDVPAEAIQGLHGRVMKARKAPYCPNVGDYRAAWNEWDYWAEQNAVERNDYLALPQAMAASDTPRFVQLFQACGPVMCKCPETVSSNGKYLYPSMAQLMTVGELMEAGRDNDYTGLDFTNCTRPWEKGVPRYWVCASGACDFCVDADKLDEVLPVKRTRDGEGFSAIGEVLDSLGKAPRVAEAVTIESTTTASPVSDEELLSTLVECGFPVEKKGEAVSLEFGRYLIRQLGVAGLNARDAVTLWPEFKAQQREAVA